MSNLRLMKILDLILVSDLMLKGLHSKQILEDLISRMISELINLIFIYHHQMLNLKKT